ncbi:aminotransferase class I/II-fold pyridoxal phosphate-dependent enzyme [Deminuibacter soli]|uniref:Aminotransferase class I/II-fold pyridoxal phosphate-dependent enzyme n=1 Tax=Deminuibacter soli TaxID=2291815 RepID=A0A3E1NDN2_9BACT|nr:aminotransferase class I/II-fold pyridoxal phosphate-dependent enzyme [Deminuibacter soli]RFM26083.1 aminotransferase class I/II-fold pyridoxal phosphate-dependent enzyme [Deminuibacter soli]
MHYKRMPIEAESPEEFGYDRISNNLSESSIKDKTLQQLNVTLDIAGLVLFYGDHKGLPELREQIAAQGQGLTADHVLVTAGAAGALFMIATALLTKEDHLVVIRPNYATNIETPKTIGAQISFIDLHFEDGFALDTQRIAAAITPATKLISVTVPHNPTGTMITQQQMQEIIAIAEKAGCYVLFDETYRDLSFNTPLPLGASLSPLAISVSSMSKAYGVPGIRTGWLITQNNSLLQLLLAAKEQIGICGSVIDENIASSILKKRTELMQENHLRIQHKLAIVREWIQQEPMISWIPPQGGVVCFPRIDLPDEKTAAFYERLLHQHKTYLAPGHWFDMPDQYFRLGYDWPTEQELRNGLAAISAAAREV